MDHAVPGLDAGGSLDVNKAPQDSGSDMKQHGLGCKAGECPPCVDGKTGCAPTGPFIQGTCCAKGDNLVAVGTAKGYETVGLAVGGKLVAACGGLGLDVSDLSNPAAPVVISHENMRCQNAAFGPKLADGNQVLYTAGHGDGNIAMSSINIYYVTTAKKVTSVQLYKEQNTALGGLVYHKNLLYAAAYGGGLLVYGVDSKGLLTLKGSLTVGIKNAWKVRLNSSGTMAYVADAEAGLHVISLASPTAPKLVATVATTGSPRDLAVSKDRVYVAMGGLGVDMFDVTTPASPKKLKNAAGFGSAQGVALVGDVLAVAAWNHLEVRDPRTLALIGTERVAKEFEEDVAVAGLDKDTILVGEWEKTYIIKYKPGLVAPDIYLPLDSMAIDPSKATKRALLVSNLGPLDLVISSITTSEKAFTASKGPLTIKPGVEKVLEVAYTPPANYAAAFVRLKTNDPDKHQGTTEVWLDMNKPGAKGLVVGNKLTEKAFGMLDPKGSGKLDGLKGKVLLLAYFALY